MLPPPTAVLESERLTAYTNVRHDILGLVPPGAKRVLDLGCSDGTLGRVLKLEAPDRHVTGVEYSPELARRAGEKLDRVIHADLNQPDALHSLQGSNFDCAVCADVLEHLQQPAELLARLRPYLAPGATLIVSLPNVRHLSVFVAIFLQGSFPRRPRGIFDDSHLRWFTYRDGRQLLQDAGFQIGTVVCNLRWGDKGGGPANRLLNRLLGNAAPWIPPVRELLTYQFAIRGQLPDAGPGAG